MEQPSVNQVNDRIRARIEQIPSYLTPDPVRDQLVRAIAAERYSGKYTASDQPATGCHTSKYAHIVQHRPSYLRKDTQ